MNNKLLSYAIVITMSFIPAIILAQTNTITRKIYNEQGAAIAAATIRIKNTNTSGTSSTDNGTYTLQVSESADSLIVSAIGYSTNTVAIRGNVIDIQLLVSSAQNLDEVIVVGYGTQRKGDLTAPIAT